MKPINHTSSCESGKFEKNKSERRLIQEKFDHFKRTAPASSNTEQLWQSNSIRLHKRQVSEVPNFSPPFDKLTSMDQNHWRASETSSSGVDKIGKIVSRRQKFSELYQQRLKGIMEKKKHDEENVMNNIMQKISEDSV